MNNFSGKRHTQTLMVLSLEPVANHSLPGSMAMQRTQPRWPLMTLISFQGGCHSGRTVCSALRGTSCCVPLLRTRAWENKERIRDKNNLVC